VYGSGAWTYGAWRVWPVMAHIMAHVLALDAQTCPKRGCSWSGLLIDNDVDLLRVSICEILAHDLIELIGYPYQ
jgi:hypothetical protein